jgi:uncharacterized protein
MMQRTNRFDLDEIAVVDNHCHPLLREQPHHTSESWRRYFTEASEWREEHLFGTDGAYYRRLIAAMATYFDVEPNDAAVLEARSRVSPVELAQRLFSEARVGGVVIDLGYPGGDVAMEPTDFIEATGVDYGALLRVELLFQQRVSEEDTLDAVIARLDEDFADLRRAGYVGLKSIVGYRTGLDIERWSSEDVARAFNDARREVQTHGALRLGFKPLLDHLLHRAMQHAARQEIPVQFHVGYGDHDVDLRSASPLLLRPIMEDPAYRGMSIVLLHGCWPYYREGAFLASIYENVYLDISFGIPFLGMLELREITRAVLSTAPFDKVMYSSDGARVPEIYWLSARDGRRLVSSTLEEMVDMGDVSPMEVQDIAVKILSGNARRLYALGSTLE